MRKLIEEQAESQAKHLLMQARSNEPLITADLAKVASEVSAEMIGLENKFKTIESLTYKISERLIIRTKRCLAQGLTETESSELVLKTQFETVNDVLRYTFVFPAEKYTFGYKQTVSLLKSLNYTFIETSIWNAWKNIGTTFDKGYRGINTTIISSQKQEFELQFHTKESFELKIQTHKLYKESRLRETSKSRKAEIAKMMVNLATNIPLPQGVKKL